MAPELDPKYKSRAYSILLEARELLEEEKVKPVQGSDLRWGSDWDRSPNPKYNPKLGYKRLGEALELYMFERIDGGISACVGDIKNIPVNDSTIDLFVKAYTAQEGVVNRKYRGDDGQYKPDVTDHQKGYIEESHDIMVSKIRQYASQLFQNGNRKKAHKLMDLLP